MTTIKLFKQQAGFDLQHLLVRICNPDLIQNNTNALLQ